MARNKITMETALYERLSRDDDNAGDSNSIVHQKEMLEDYAKKNGFENIVHYTDDGWSGASFDRPAWNELVNGVKEGRIATVIVKDLSRVGRDHLQVGFFTDILFREKEIRFIAIGNGVDSNNQESSEFAPFLNIMNEWYVRDTSKKIKSVLKSRGMTGKAHTSNHTPYGYMKDPNDSDHWIIDEEAAAVVRRIFQMAVDGKGPYEIARILSAEKIERPSVYLAKRGIGTHKTVADYENPYLWRGNTVKTILVRPEYKGCTVNFRTYKNSYKDKKIRKHDDSEWVIFEGTQEPIIDKHTWEIVQKAGRTKKVATKFDAPNPFTGKVFCADCGSLLYNHRKSEPRIQTYYTKSGERRQCIEEPEDYYKCSGHSLALMEFKEKCTAHTIRTKALTNIVLEVIKETCSYVKLNPEEFAKLYKQESVGIKNKTKENLEGRISKNNQKLKELEKLMRKIYEDNIAGRLADKMFDSMRLDIETEMEQIEVAMEHDSAELEKIQNQFDNTEMFIELVKKYEDFEELTPTIINEFVDKIIVHEATGTGAKRQQDIEVYLNYIGNFQVPHETVELSDEEKEAIRKREEKLERKRAYNRKYMKKYRKYQKEAEALDKASNQ